MEKHSFVGKNLEEAIKEAEISLQETRDNLIITEKEVKAGLFKSKKTEIEVIEKREVVKYIKNYISTLVKDLGFSANIELKNGEVPTYIIYSNNDSLLIGKNGKNLQALSKIISQVILKEIGQSFKFLIDVNEYKEKHQKSLEIMAKKIAREVQKTKVEAKLNSLNSYERRIIHNTLSNNKYVYTESIGEEPNRYLMIKPKEE